MVRSQLAQGAGDKAEIAIIRKSEKGQERIIADEDAELQPGDTVEIALHYQDGPDAPVRRLSSLSVPQEIGRTDATAADSLRVGRR
jgi:polysaccharide biosynthesis/export protein